MTDNPTEPREVVLCLLCGAFVPKAESDAHCAEHERQRHAEEGK